MTHTTNALTASWPSAIKTIGTDTEINSIVYETIYKTGQNFPKNDSAAISNKITEQISVISTCLLLRKIDIMKGIYCVV